MEAIENASQEEMIKNLEYSIPTTSRYVNDRESVTFQPSGGNIYSGENGKIIKFRLSGDQKWLDGNSVRIVFDVYNNGDPDTTVPLSGGVGPYKKFDRLYPVPGAAHGFFKKLKITSRGVIIEEINNYNRIAEMFSLLQSKEKRMNELRSQTSNHVPYTDYDPTEIYKDNVKRIRGQESSTFVLKLHSGLLSQPKFLPLRYMNLEIELELDDNMNAAINYLPDADGYTPAGTDEATINAEFNKSWRDQVSNKWFIENAFIRADVVTVDNNLDNTYASLLLSGKSMNIIFNTYISQIQTILSNDMSIPISRSLSRLDGVFVSLIKDYSKANNPSRYIPNRKEFNDFVSPLYLENSLLGYNKASIVEKESDIQDFYIQIGGKQYPQYPIRSSVEAYHYLQKYFNNNEISINGLRYSDNQFIMGIDTRKVQGLAFTGVSTKNSDLIVHLKLPAMTALDKMDRINICLVHTIVLEINDQGVMVYN